MAFKLTNAFFYIGLDRSRLTNLSGSRSIWLVDSERIHHITSSESKCIL